LANDTTVDMLYVELNAPVGVGNTSMGVQANVKMVLLRVRNSLLGFQKFHSSAITYSLVVDAVVVKLGDGLTQLPPGFEMHIS
jgi:hypothetical protein